MMQKNVKHIGSYGIIIKEDKILLIKKVGGPYDGKLDLPGGTIEFDEIPADTLIRELKEEVGINVKDYKVLDANSVNLAWEHKGEIENIKHIFILYEVLNYEGNIKDNIEITEINDDSKGASFYSIKELKRDELSLITISALERLGYELQ